MNMINQRLESLREVMKREHLAAFIFPSTDAHQSEYVADHWMGRAWISGFDGSAGTAVVTMHSAALWTDSRYFLAAEEQLKGTEFQLMKLKIPGTLSIAEWLGKELQDVDSPEVGLDGWVNSYSSTSGLIADLRKAGGITVRTNFDPLEEIWKDRPSIPLKPVEIQPMEFAGEDVSSKIKRIRLALRAQHADGMLVSALDDIAWTLNLRGTDVHCVPVFVSYLLIASDKVSLFVDEAKVSSEIRAYLESNGVSIYKYNKVEEGLKAYSEYNILLDGNETSYYLWKAVRCQEIVQASSPIPAMKAVKNEAEIAGYRSAMLKDGVAMVKFLKWLLPAVEAGGETEISIDKKLTALRAEQKLFRDISFDTIAGYQAHGAIVHYEATPETDIPLKPEGLLLLDSGAQYQDGTTDITRTVVMGPTTEEEKKYFTAVLRGTLNLGAARFLHGCTGVNLDILARQPLWEMGEDFKHGTGHGVGYLLNVHEGPNSFRWKIVPGGNAVLEEGMITSDEPGYYREDGFGIRHENLMVCKKAEKTEYGQFMCFEFLTMVPFDLDGVVPELMSVRERNLLNDYHAQVYEKISPYLNEEEKEWLKDATRAI